ncbi:MAG: glycoside hydrolase family 92 protein, partial [Paramuribaculum sp.]|nr:glycoside hydrolase family 92 protein [Paramuribaculum sp.]
LDSLFIVEGDLGEDASPDISGMIGQYAHGNEPSHHVAYLYNYAGQPAKGAKIVRRVVDELYDAAPDGLCGNEDVGQMSAWYVLSSAGLYQVEPAGGRFVIGSPVFDSVSISLPGNKQFIVKTVNNSPENIYIQSATLNSKPYAKGYIDYEDIMAGGTLELTMGPKPSDFATSPENRP